MSDHQAAALEKRSSAIKKIDDPKTEVQRAHNSIVDQIDRIVSMLPAQARQDGHRFVMRCLNHLHQCKGVDRCTSRSIVQAVLDAAECGLPIDGKLGYAVAYANRKKIGGEWRTVDEVQFQPSYVGLRAVAVRNRRIVDCYADVVRENDKFEHGRVDGECRLSHTFPFSNRGDIVGAYAIVKLPSGDWRYEVMGVSEVNEIRDRSSGWQAFKAGKIKSTPWGTDYAEMSKKTVMRRALKLHVDDPTLERALSFDERDYVIDVEAAAPKQLPKAEVLGIESSAQQELFPADKSDDGSPADLRQEYESRALELGHTREEVSRMSTSQLADLAMAAEE